MGLHLTIAPLQLHKDTNAPIVHTWRTLQCPNSKPSRITSNFKHGTKPNPWQHITQGWTNDSGRARLTSPLWKLEVCWWLWGDGGRLARFCRIGDGVRAKCRWWRPWDLWVLLAPSCPFHLLLTLLFSSMSLPLALPLLHRKSIIPRSVARRRRRRSRRVFVGLQRIPAKPTIVSINLSTCENVSDNCPSSRARERNTTQKLQCYGFV